MAFITGRSTISIPLAGIALLAGCASVPAGAGSAGTTAGAGARTGTLIVANMGDNTASILDAGTHRTLATLPTGAGPHEVAISHDGRWAVVTNYGVRGAPGNTLTLIDLTVPAVARTIELGGYQRPHGAAFLPGDSVLAVTSEVRQMVMLVNLARGAVDTAVTTGQRASHMLAITADGRRAYTSNVADGSISELDLAGRRLVRTIAVAPQVEGITVTPDGAQVWVGSNQAKTVSVIDTRSSGATPAATFDGFGMPYRLAATPDGRTIVVSDPIASALRVYDVATRSERGRVAIPPLGVLATSEFSGSASPEGLTISRDGRTVYVALQGTNQVAAVDLATRAILAYLPTGKGPDGIGYSPLTSGAR